jgi:hypothetical protein
MYTESQYIYLESQYNKILSCIVTINNNINNNNDYEKNVIDYIKLNTNISLFMKKINDCKVDWVINNPYNDINNNYDKNICMLNTFIQNINNQETALAKNLAKNLLEQT